MNLDLLDWTVIAVFMTGTLALAHGVRGAQTNLSDYFLASRSLSWITVGLCLYATLFSTVSFVAIPGEAYLNGALFSINSIGYALFTPLAVWIFLRFAYNASSFTAYEYLERRFDRRVRILGAIVFLVARSLYMAVVFYSAARIFASLLGWSPWATITVVGAFTIYYSYHGGMKAIALTDALMSVIIFAAIAFIVGKLCLLIDFDIAGFARAVHETGRGFGVMATPGFYSFDPHARYTFWTALVLAILGPLTNYGTDQLFVQRMLSTKSYAAAKRAIWLKTLIAVPVSLALYLVGLLMFYYYERVTAAGTPAPADQMLGYFINQHLPSPMPGFVAAALLAALMSTVSSTAASLATVTSIDIMAFVPPLRRWAGRHAVRAGKALTVFWGGVSTLLAMALVYAGRGVETTVLEVAQVWSALWLVLLAVMMGGIFTQWITARAAFLALVSGIGCNLLAPYLLYYRVPAEDRISFVWMGMPGFVLAGAILVIVSLFDPRRPRNVHGLTWKTVDRSRL
ncbi:MAG: sodium:solute symporter family transporter [Opitutaceae bacterium]